MADDYVLTPGGYKPATQVHHVRRRHHVKMRDDVAELHHLDHGLIEEIGHIAPHQSDRPLLPDNLSLHPPGGPGFHPPSGAIETAQAHGLAAGTFAKISGWIGYTGWSNTSGSPISRLATSWEVPPEPTRRGRQTVFLFSGIQNATMIYQPVLQWGRSAAGGGRKWSVGCWYADSQSGHSFYSDLVDVHVGQQLTGVMELTGRNGALCDYRAEFVGIPHTELIISDVPELAWANETLEAYQIGSRADYPATPKTVFTGITLETGDTPPGLAWTPYAPHQETGGHVSILDGGSENGVIEIWYEAE